MKINYIYTLVLLKTLFLTVFSKIILFSQEFPYDMTPSDINGWTQVNGTISTLVNCGGFTRFGEFGGLNPWAEKTYTNLPPHYSVTISYENLDIRSFDSERTNLIVDDQIRTSSYFSEYYTWKTYARPCTGGAGQTWKGLLYPRAMSVNITHNSDTMKVRFQSTINSGAYDESFGISNLNIHVDECHVSCLTCDGPTQNNCLSCPTNSVSGPNNDCYCNSPNYFHDHTCIAPACPSGFKQNKVSKICEQECSDNCNSCTNLRTCTSCQTGYYILNGFCVNNCPFYTSKSGNLCVDSTYNSISNPYVLAQDMSNKVFATPDLTKNGWQPGVWETQTHEGIEYRYTNMATEICNGVQLALGNQFNREYTCDPECSFFNNYSNLPPHYGYNLKAQIWMGDNWQGQSMKIEVDGTQIHTYSHTVVPGVRSFDCGQNTAQAASSYIYDVSITNKVHSQNTLTLAFKWNQPSIALLAWLALRDVQVILLQCDIKCLSCSDGTSCDVCQPTRQGTNCDTPISGYYDDGINRPQFLQCSYQCLECTGNADNCTKCRFYDDSSKLPSCQKPTNCLKYASVKSVGFNQIQSQGSTQFKVDGSIVAETQETGITIVNLGYDGTYVDHQTFNTHSNPSACNDLNTYLSAITKSHVVMLGIHDSGTHLLNSSCSSQLAAIGWNPNLNIEDRDSYAIISRKTYGWLYPHNESLVKSSVINQSAYVEECIVECDFQCAECSGTSNNCTKCKYFGATPPSCGVPNYCLTYVDVFSAGMENGNKFQAKINGSVPSGQTNSRGMNIVEIDDQGTVYSQIRYDTYASNQSVLDLEQKINGLPNGRYILMGINDEGSNQFNIGANTGYETMETIGYDRTQTFGGRDGLAIIGKKGASSNQVLQKVSPRHDIGRANVQQCLKECDLKCETCSGNSNNCDTCSSNLRKTTDCGLPENCGKFVYLKSVGHYYSKWHASDKSIKLYINDIDVSFSQNNGVHFLVFDEQGQVDSTQSFDYSSDTTQLTSMVNFINGITTGRKVLVVSKDDMSINMTASGYTALQSLGLSDSVTLGFRESFTMIGQKGFSQGDAQYAIGQDKPGATQLQGCAMGCQYQCATCQTETYNCLSCSHSTRPNTSDCECQIGTFDVGVPECSECDYKCETCETNKNNCLTCADTNRDVNNSCLCKDSWYNQGTQKLCVKCPNKFAKCTSDTVGLECQGANRSSTLNSCPCNTGYYDDNTNSADCVKCNAKCTICTSDSVCSECSDGYYLSGTSCIQCPNKFAKCSSATVGIECQGLNRSSILDTCPCNTGWFDDNTNKADCTKCDVSCSQCTSNSVCQSCNDGYYKDENSCPQCLNKFARCSSENVGLECQGSNRSTDFSQGCQCNSNYFDDGTNKANCDQCNSNCKECSGNSTYCLECYDGFYLESNVCIKCPSKFAKCQNQTVGLECQGQDRSSILDNCPCNIGFYDDLTNADCVQCTLGCKECSSGSVCTDCIDQYFQSGNSCNQCLNKYARCTDNQTPLECQGQNRQTDHTQGCLCEQGYFDDGTNKTDCQQCNEPCQTCEQTADKCLSCIDKFYLTVNTCTECPVRYNKCTSDSIGTECTIGQERTMIKPDCGCNPGYFDNNVTDCQICTSPCKQCTGSNSNCTECIDGYYLSGNSCLQCDLTKCQTCQNTDQECIICADNTRGGENCDCLDGYFDQGVAECGKCDYQCETCSGTSSSCDLCSDDNRDFTDSCKCKDTFYDKGEAKCGKCQYPCLNCSELGVCLSCQSVSRSIPKCSCSQGYYEQENVQDCQECDIQCSICKQESNNCMLCERGKFRSLIIPECGCRDGYYAVDGQIDCQACFSGCKTCSSYDVCTECNNKNFGLPGCVKDKYITQQQFSFEVVQNGNVITVENGKCDFQCLTCENSSNNCTKCKVGLNRNQDIPSCKCHLGYHDMNQTSEDCQKCPNVCKTCIDNLKCLTCHEQSNRYLDPIELKCNCLKGFTQSKFNPDICLPCYQYKGQCFEECPQNTVQDDQHKNCSDLIVSQNSNTALIFSCLAVIVILQVLFFFILKMYSSKKVNKLQEIKHQKIKQKDMSNNSQEEKNNSMVQNNIENV